MSRAAAIAIVLIAFGFPLSARALVVTGFEPRDVTVGTRLTIRGDFAELAGGKARPMVQGRRLDTSKVVKFQVLAFSRRTIIARVRDVPSTKSDPAAGKMWSLVVSSADQSESVEADGPLTTSGPLLVSLADAEAMPGKTLGVFAIDPGTKPPTVMVGRKKAKVLRGAPAGQNPDDDPWLVEVAVPHTWNGFHPVRLENSVGRAPETATLLVYGSDLGGVIPYANAAVQGRAALDARVCTWSGSGGHVHVSACAGDPCTRTLSVDLAPDPGGGYAPAQVELTTANPYGGAPEVLESVSAEAKLLPSPSPELLAGAFVAELQPVGEPSAAPLRIRGYFQASPGE